MKNYVWIVEMKFSDKWKPSANVRLTRKSAIGLARHLRSYNSVDDSTAYRVKKYEVKQ